MKTRCKHVWERVRFLGDPVAHSNICEILESCSGCGKERQRPTTFEERAEEHKVRTCQDCGYQKHEHDFRKCIGVMSDRIRMLEDRISDIERWRSG